MWSEAVRTRLRRRVDNRGGQQSGATVVAPLAAAILRAQPASCSSLASLGATLGYYTLMGIHQRHSTPTSTRGQRAPPPPYGGCVCAWHHRSCKVAGGRGACHRAGGGDTLRTRADRAPKARTSTHAPRIDADTSILASDLPLSLLPLGL